MPSKTQPSDAALSAIEALWDGLAAASAVLGAVAIYEALRLGKHVHYSHQATVIAAALFGAFFVLLLDWDGAYSSGYSLMRIKETERILRVFSTTVLATIPFMYLTGRLIPRWIVILSLVLAGVLLVAAKSIFYAMVQALRAHGYGVRNVVIYGADSSGKRVLSALARSHKLGLSPVAIVDDDPFLAGSPISGLGYSRKTTLRVIRGPISPELIRQYDARLLVIAMPSISSDDLTRAAEAANLAGADLAFMPHYASLDRNVDILDIDGELLASYGKGKHHSQRELLKRTFDLVVSGVSLLLIPPFLALIALLVRMDSPGPALFVQTRIGKNGRQFKLYKFRSMYVDAPRYSRSPVHGQDPRITRLGRFLRRTSLDELPQLLNVLTGNMSLVGPRPEMPSVVAQYTARERQRLAVTPGITGLWQLSADRALPIHENLQYDLYYIRNGGFFMDIAILLHTVVFAMRGI
ncbi:MAG: sugar transferase [Terracidiphilus sp.]